MADHTVVAWNELYENVASWASVFCFGDISSEKPSGFISRSSLFYLALPTSFCVPECHQKG